MKHPLISALMLSSAMVMSSMSLSVASAQSSKSQGQTFMESLTPEQRERIKKKRAADSIYARQQRINERYGPSPMSIKSLSKDDQKMVKNFIRSKEDVAFDDLSADARAFVRRKYKNHPDVPPKGLPVLDPSKPIDPNIFWQGVPAETLEEIRIFMQGDKKHPERLTPGAQAALKRAEVIRIELEKRRQRYINPPSTETKKRKKKSKLSQEEYIEQQMRKRNEMLRELKRKKAEEAGLQGAETPSGRTEEMEDTGFSIYTEEMYRRLLR